MSARCAIAGVLAAAAGATVLGAAAPAPAVPATAAPPARLLVQATEFRFMLSRPSVDAGRVIVELVDNGEDPHDLHLVRLDRRGRAAGATRAIPETAPGAGAQWRGRLTAGRWKLSCSLAGHERLGMRAILRVR